MRSCLQLAEKGFGMVSPNPMVGCIFVKDNQIIGKGYHAEYGGPHAEVNAAASVRDKSAIKGSTVYVSLEPCSHHGKTPPCAELLIRLEVAEVIIGTQDPNPKVAGAGIRKLEDAGIKVRCGILEKECRLLNKRFFTFHTKHRPYVILKWAESADGFISGINHKRISGLVAQTRLHRWRSEEDAFLIGTNTLTADNPMLNTRLWKGKNPIRAAVDFELRSEHMALNFYDKSQRTIILNGLRETTGENPELIKIASREPEIILKALFSLNIGSVVVEGGAALLNSFLKSGLYDEIRRFRSKKLILENGVAAPKIDFIHQSEEDLIDDILLIY